ncbi:MAG: hypothetical protein GVY12_08495 [Bacteroidetes bacterium]|jgi:uncharacterized damage-inducible protein DinB|nr:hypothetical protein [Bacteroidota bacterium]
MSTKKDDLIALLDHELQGTRRMLERVPDDRFDWKPHEKSFSLGELAMHISNLLSWMTSIMREPSVDLGTTPDDPPVPARQQALLDHFDVNADDLRAAVSNIDNTDMGESWQLTQGGQPLIDEPRISVFYKMGLNHLIHHRGQLSVYLRMLDAPVPPTYGPTADERGPF